MESSNQEENDLTFPLHRAFHCIHCDTYSFDPNSCVNCGKLVPDSDLMNFGQLVSNIIEVNVVDLNKAANVDSKARKREINCYGMFLKEQKQLNSKTSQRLDSEAMIKKWKGLDETEKDVYRKKAAEDKIFIMGKKSLSETKDEDSKKGSDEEERSKKNRRNKRDVEVKTKKRELFKETENDLSSAKLMLSCMIAEKEESLLVLGKSLEINEKEIARLSDENSLSARLLISKKEKLLVVKQNYKDLFSHNSIKK